ncbi:MAG TPA: prepilin-type N-terminal cleavage/methylation domain-containing protein [Pseudobdellovibrionaceae bacterium]|jgi:prepilin-type N-terminal cleavage/methylation domain-containing protein
MSSVHNSSNSGFTLVEVLVATGLFGLLTAAVAIAAMAFLKSAQQTNLRITRDQIVTQLKMTALNKKAILLSIKKPENVALYNCVCGVGTCANVQQPYLAFTLYGTNGNIESPLYYDSSGSPCDPTSPQCVVRVKTSFFAQCKPDLASVNQNPPLTCNGTPAEFVSIVYTVDENPAAVSGQSVRLKPVSGPIYIQTVDMDPGVCL